MHVHEKEIEIKSEVRVHVKDTEGGEHMRVSEREMKRGSKRKSLCVYL